MRYCKLCVQPDTRPRIRFSEDGTCFACLHALKWRTEVDWAARREEIDQIARDAIARSTGYDCVIGVSGGKDSTVQSFYARDTLGLNCLLVNCAPDNITDAGRANLENLRQHGFDLVSFSPNPTVMRWLVRASFYEYGNPIKPTEYPLFAVTFQMALKFGIPLVILGENPGITLGVDYLGDDDDAMGIVEGHTLAGGDLAPWLQVGVPEKDLLLYEFPSRADLDEAGVKAVYLAHYIEDWSFHANVEFAQARGLVGRPDWPNEMGRLSPLSAVDSDMQIVNQMLKYLKFGFGFVTDEVCYAIRDGLMDRKYAISAVEMYDGRCGQQYIAAFCQYIGISLEEFWKVVGRWVNPTLFRPPGDVWEGDLVAKAAGHDFTPKFKVGEGLPDG